jgi:hypothetical protein
MNVELFILALAVAALAAARVARLLACLLARRRASRWRAEETSRALVRAAYLVDHLAVQVTEFTGVTSPDGHREDDYIREQLHAEAEGWRTLAGRCEATP